MTTLKSARQAVWRAERRARAAAEAKSPDAAKLADHARKLREQMERQFRQAPKRRNPASPPTQASLPVPVNSMEIPLNHTHVDGHNRRRRYGPEDIDADILADIIAAVAARLSE